MPNSTVNNIKEKIENSWKKIAPSWPLQNLVSINPLSGFEEMNFKAALKHGQIYFQKNEIPKAMEQVNLESIKWLKEFLCCKQSIIAGLLNDHGLIKTLLTLLVFDGNLSPKARKQAQYFADLDITTEDLILELLIYLDISKQNHEEFLTLMLTTLPGWAAHIQYLASYVKCTKEHVSKENYLAFRLLLTCLIWPEAKELLLWHESRSQQANVDEIFHQITLNERPYIKSLKKRLKSESFNEQKHQLADAQLIFCVDAREERFRRIVESAGNYQTFGCAGFFGVPIIIENSITQNSYQSCPYFIKPIYKVTEKPKSETQKHINNHNRLQQIKNAYQAVNCNFVTSSILSVIIGIPTALWMFTKTFSPKLSYIMKSKFQDILRPKYISLLDLNLIPLNTQAQYAYNLLKTIGLTECFAPLIVFCGHRSEGENNAHINALHCGACGGNHGGPNARILSAILNKPEVRLELQKKDINIPKDTFFISAEHNTATNGLEFFEEDIPETSASKIYSLKTNISSISSKYSSIRCKDWAIPMPERGLSENASFIVGPRWLTQNIDLDGSSFLHSYEWSKDEDGSSLASILTGSMLVIHSINSQYLFSAIDNVGFGAGSIISENIIESIGVMQGNASDLMNGLPLEFANHPKHKLMRLNLFVYAPQKLLDRLIKKHSVLQKLFGNEWINLTVIEPNKQP